MEDRLGLVSLLTVEGEGDPGMGVDEGVQVKGGRRRGWGEEEEAIK